MRDRSHEGEPERLRSSAQHCSCEQSQALHPSRGARELSVFMAAERTSQTSDQHARTCGARGRPGADRRATRRSRSDDRAACQCEESRSRRTWIQPAARVAAFPGGFGRRACAPPRRVGSTDCPVGRSFWETRSDNFERIVHTTAPCSSSARPPESSVRSFNTAHIPQRDSLDESSVVRYGFRGQNAVANVSNNAAGTDRRTIGFGHRRPARIRGAE